MMIKTANDNVANALVSNTRLKNYVIHSILGRGAFGITYLAYDQDLECFVAIKEYLPHKIAVRKEDKIVQPYDSRKSKQFYYGLKSFIDEAKTLAKFKHPNIVHILRLFEENETAYIVMQYEKGTTLKHYIENNGDVSEQRLLEIFCPIHDGLLLVHRAGYIHRDIKPTNIIIRENNTPVLIDFGAARNILHSKSINLTKIFTPGYAPLEQCFPTYSEQGAWTDIYALGATIYFSITGTRIDIAQKRKINDSYISLSSKYNQQYHHHFLQAIDKALFISPKKRPQDLEEWNKDLKFAFSKKKGIKSSCYKRSVSLIAFGISLFVILSFVYYLDNSYFLTKEKNNRPIIEDDNTNKITENTLEDIEKLIFSSKNKIMKDDLSFDDAVEICDVLNKKLSVFFHKELRKTYLISLKKTLSIIQKNNLKNTHDNWIKNRGDNIKKNKQGVYEVNVDFEKELLENKNLYANLTIESYSIPLSIEIVENNECTKKTPCKTPFVIKKLQPGEKKIRLINKNNKINISSTINIHPNQNYVLRIK